MKKICLRLSLLTFFALVSFSCATAPQYVPVTYSGDKLIYPAVREAVKTVIADAQFDNVDIFANKFLVKNIGAMDGINQRRFDLEITATNGSVNYELKNVKLYMTESQKWEDNSSFLFFNPNTLYTKFNNIISPILSDDVKYESSKKAALSDIVFLYFSLKDMNSISIKDFLTTELSTIAFDVTGEVFEVEEKVKVIDEVEYKYRVHFSQNITKELNKDLTIDLFSNTITYFMYTNDSAVARYNKGLDISTKIKVVNANRSTLGGFVMEVVKID